MTTQAHETAMRTQITIRAPNVHAFKVFTRDFGRVKPPEHTSLGALRRVPSSHWRPDRLANLTAANDEFRADPQSYA